MQRPENGVTPCAESKYMSVMKIEKLSHILFIVSPHIETLDALTQREFAALYFFSQRQPASHSHTNVLPQLVASQFINN